MDGRLLIKRSFSFKNAEIYCLAINRTNLFSKVTTKYFGQRFSAMMKQQSCTKIEQRDAFHYIYSLTSSNLQCCCYLFQIDCLCPIVLLVSGEVNMI